MMIALISGEVLIHCFLWIVVIALIAWLGYWLLGFLKVPEPFNRIILVVGAVIVFLLLVNAILMLVGKQFIA